MTVAATLRSTLGHEPPVPRKWRLTWGWWRTTFRRQPKRRYKPGRPVLRAVATPSRSVLAAFIAIVFIAGANVIVVQFSNRELAPFWSAGFRFLLAGTVLTFAAL